MKLAAVRAIAALAREEPSDVVARAYGGETPIFGPDFLIPSPFDPRLILRIAPAVAKAAMETGVATRPITDFAAYDRQAEPLRVPLRLRHEADVLDRQGASAKRVIYADGEDERVLRAAQVVLEEGIAEPILIGRPQSSRSGSSASACASGRASISSSSIPRTIRAIATMSTC